MSSSKACDEEQDQQEKTHPSNRAINHVHKAIPPVFIIPANTRHIHSSVNPRVPKLVCHILIQSTIVEDPVSRRYFNSRGMMWEGEGEMSGEKYLGFWIQHDGGRDQSSFLENHGELCSVVSRRYKGNYHWASETIMKAKVWAHPTHGAALCQ